MKKQDLDRPFVKRSYSQMVDDFLNEMLRSSPFNSVEWVRFKDIQLDDYIYYSIENVSNGGEYERSVRYKTKTSMKRWLKKKNVKYNGEEDKIAKCLLVIED